MGLVILAVVITLSVVLLIRLFPDRGDSGPPAAVAEVGELRAEVLRFTRALRSDARYRPPDNGERQTLSRVIDQLATQGRGAVDAAAGELLALGYTTSTGTDKGTGREFVLVSNTPGAERGWGMYVIDLSQPARVVIEVPHPAFDLRTEEIGVAIYRRTPGAVLAIAGTHRRAANGAGDVAHRADSMFHAVAERLAGRGLPQVQLHGFDDASLPSADVVLSSGATKAAAALPAVSDRLAGAGLRVCSAWRDKCAELEGRRNEQGITAAELGSAFAHVELSRTVRDDPGRTATVVDALSGADLR